MRRLTLLSFGIFIALTLTAQAPESSTSDEIIEQIELLIIQAMKQNDIPALSMCLIYDGEILASKGYGVKKRNFQEPVDERTIYQIASLSKTFTGIIANNLVHEQKLDTENSITDYLPATLPSKTVRKLENIRVIDVLRHRSGMPRDSRVIRREDGEPMINGYSEEDLLFELQKVRLKNKPGKKYRYSNLGYAVIGYILERASGLSYSELLRRYVTDKYELGNTTVQLSANNKSEIATPYRKEFRGMETKPWNTGKLVSASGIYSCIEDLSKLLLLQLNAYQEGQNSTNPLVLTQENHQIKNSASSYGFGLFETKTSRGILYGHRGDMDGFASEYSFNPSRNTGVILLTSSGGDWLGLLSAKINKILEESQTASSKM